MDGFSALLSSGGLALAGGALFPVAVGLGSSATHCAGMCGPIHFYLASRGGSGRSLWRYHAGRIIGYILLGLLAGLLGGLTGDLGADGFKAAAGWVLAGLYAWFGLQLLGWMPTRLRPESLAGNLFPARLFGRMSAKAFLFPAGLLASLLPCPSTHAVLLFGMGLGEPLLASAAMAALGASTLPVFSVLTAVRNRLPASKPWARHYGTVLGALFIGLSAWRVYGAAFAGTPACH